MSTLLFLSLFLSTLLISHQQLLPSLDPTEQEAAYQVLSSINPTIPWSSLFPDDLCLSSPHGVVCSYLFTTQNDTTPSPHITEFNFGYVSDFNSNPPCTPNSTLNPLLFTSFKYLRKLFFYNCFTSNPLFFPDVTSFPSFGSELEELVLIENPGLTGPLSGILGNFTNLRRLVISGNGIYGNIPGGVGDYLVNVEEVTFSRNNLRGGVPIGLSKLRKLKVLDLSYNGFDGIAPDSLGELSQLLKLDLSHNGLFGKIPESLGKLKGLEFLDLSYNRFGNFGIPLFLGRMDRLKEVYLSGNLLGGRIPEIWENLGGISGIGFSNMSLIGNIPRSMGVHLRNLCYLGLDNNFLEGELPEKLGALEFVSLINLENNNLTGPIPFSAQFTAKKLKFRGNSGLCVGESQSSGGILGNLKLCDKLGDSSKPVLSMESSVACVALFAGSARVLFLSFGLVLVWVFV